MPRRKSEPDVEVATPATRRFSRRRFIALIAAGGAALPATDVLAATAPRRTKATPAKAGTVKITPTPSYQPPPPPGPALEKGLKESRDSLAGQLKAIRDFDLPPGSEQAFAFRPLRRERRPR
jgi:hypothetical protein